MALIYCKECGQQISDSASCCPHCGFSYEKPLDPDVSEKDWLTAILLCLFVGGFGVHSFYVGKSGVGIIQLLTLGGCGIWVLVDLIMLACGNYADADGKILKSK